MLSYLIKEHKGTPEIIFISWLQLFARLNKLKWVFGEQ